MEKYSDIYGLVLAGGFSKRMGRDKSLLNFHGKPQFEYLFEILQSFCEQVFLSCRKEQSDQFGNYFPKIFDRYDGIGPMNGLLSFFEKHPSKACLLVACDMPFINKESIKYLIENRDSNKMATAFRGYKNIAEPLLTIWEPTSYNTLNNFFKIKNYSLRDVLQTKSLHILNPPNDKILLNINKPDEFNTIQKALNLPPEKL